MEDSKQSSDGSIDTAGFRVGLEELEWIILAILKQSPERKCAQKSLFGKVLSQLQMRPRDKTREDLSRVFFRLLSKLKEQGKIKFASAKTRTYVMLC
jgi:hypothetical protein